MSEGWKKWQDIRISERKKGFEGEVRFSDYYLPLLLRPAIWLVERQEGVELWMVGGIDCPLRDTS